ncbi:bifunctional adenosylcobinamide kinase/adenosylcobinamide-phosphate guanylyltransferase [Paracoccus luteus]|uniref:bifunctional adenosylcobinamide kinase/adenosylcobinamide-phosphate guanylyltransferase n=1 Tax=Paracoccus luteus TaxID=2508543 RepID=UPI00106FAFF3|nr:bifunctional adenosylcobinamide kinase/adenosylcobinamide-phosphate guanylyltransferase [Paracoccus luteus]
MTRITLITGGARSGKSRIAETLALRAGRAVYLATAEARDAEMADRIKAHRERRGPQWTDRAAPLDLPAALAETDGMGPRLVDCLTLWLTNLMLGGHDIDAAAAALLAALGTARDPVVLVTNEVGAGIVPDNALARRFRDAAGLLNQQVAAAADRVVLVACGLPLVLKGPALDKD